jgi:hypothetical protein
MMTMVVMMLNVMMTIETISVTVARWFVLAVEPMLLMSMWMMITVLSSVAIGKRHNKKECKDCNKNKINNSAYLI